MFYLSVCHERFSSQKVESNDDNPLSSGKKINPGIYMGTSKLCDCSCAIFNESSSPSAANGGVKKFYHLDSRNGCLFY